MTVVDALAPAGEAGVSTAGARTVCVVVSARSGEVVATDRGRWAEAMNRGPRVYRNVA
jgi:hypothetical protein